MHSHHDHKICIPQTKPTFIYKRLQAMIFSKWKLKGLDMPVYNMRSMTPLQKYSKWRTKEATKDSKTKWGRGTAVRRWNKKKLSLRSGRSAKRRTLTANSDSHLFPVEEFLERRKGKKNECDLSINWGWQKQANWPSPNSCPENDWAIVKPASGENQIILMKKAGLA